MFDAAAALTATDLQNTLDTQHTDARAADSLAKFAIAATVSVPVEVRAVDPALNNGRKEVAFIDTGVADYQTLVDGIRAGVEVVLLDAGQDGLAQMAVWAQSHTGYDAVHVLSHGADGTLYLGRDILNQAQLADAGVQSALIALGKSLTDDGDILLYGCFIASGDAGKAFTANLASLTGADIAASDDLTGSSLLGGNWVLENGETTFALDFSSRYAFTLPAPPNGTYTFAGASSSNNNTTVNTADGFFVLSSFSTGRTMLTDADGFGAYTWDSAATGGLNAQQSPNNGAAYEAYIELRVASSGSFKVADATLGEYVNSGNSITLSKLSNIYFVGYANNVAVAQTTPYNSISAYETDYTAISFSAFNNILVDKVRAYFTVENGALASSFNLIDLSITGASTTPVQDTTAPTVTGVNSSTANGTYKVGETVSVQVNFSEAVTVTGTPQLTLETGTTDRTINYASGSGTSSLTFTYTVQAGDTTADLDYNATTALALNSGTIKDAAGNNATLTLASPGAANSLGANKAIVIDGVAPTVSGVTSSTANGAYKVGDTVSVQVNFSEAVTVTGTPQLTLETGTTDRTINYASGSGTSSLTFTYTVQAGDTTADLDYISTAALALNSGTVKDAAGNNATLTLASPGAANSLGANKNIVVDGLVPSAIALTNNTLSNSASANTAVGTLSSTDATVSDSFTYSLVAGAGSTNNASFSISGSSLVATNPSALTAGSYSVRVRTTDVAGNTYEQAFTITVTSNQAPSVTTPTAITLVDTSSTDTFSNQTGTLAATDTDGIASYGIQGGTTGGNNTIGGVTYDVSKAGTYGTLYVKSSDGSYVFVPNATAINARKTSTSETFIVTATDANASPATGTATLTVNITAANDAPTDLALSAATINQSAGTNATVGALTSTDADTGETFTYTLVSGAGDTNNGSFNISGGNLRATNPANLAAGTYSVRVRTTDASSSTYEEALSITVVDDVAPTVTSVSVPSNAWYTAGQNLDFTVNLSEAVIVNTTGGTPRIALTVGSTTVYATYVSGSGTSALTFRYTVQANELDTDGIAVGALGLNGGTIQDAAGNNATLTLNSVGSTTAVKVDAVNPSAPSAPDLVAGSDTGASSTDNITNDNTPTVSGTAEANSTVAIYDGATLLGTATADGTGSWSYTATTLSNGSHTLTARATDAAGNDSPLSTGLTITVDAAAPTAVSLSQTSVADTAATSGSTVATLSATDTNTVTYALVSGSGDTNNTSFNIVSGNLQAASNLSAGTYNIRVRATDLAGNTTDQTFTITVTAGPSVASINRAGATALTNAASVDYTVTFSESVTQVDVSDFTVTTTGTAGGTISSVSGTGSTYTVTVSGLSGDGTLRLDLKNAGTGIVNGGSQAITGGFTSGQTYTLDMTAPSAPSGLDLLASSDSGSSSTDNNTSDNTPTISGAGAEPNCTVTLYDTDGTTVLGTATADGSGNWSITSSTLSSGTHTLTTKVTDAAGNTGVASAGLTVTIDTTAPSASGTPDLASASDSGSSSTDNTTSVTTPTITGGGAEAGATVTLYDTDGTTVLGTATADGSGNWSITSSTLSSGAHTLTTKVTDAAGNTGVASAGLTVTIDTTAPTASGTPDLASASDSGSSSTDNITSVTTPTITGGGAEAGATVTLYDTDGTTVLGTATADGSGNWSISSSTLSSGAHTLTTKVTDAAGNTGVASAGLTVTIDTNPPANISLSIDQVMDLVTGVDKPIATLSSSDIHPVRFALANGNGSNDSGNGSFQISGNTLQSVNVLAAGTYNLRLSATDAAGNVSYQDVVITVLPRPVVIRNDVVAAIPVVSVQPNVLPVTAMSALPVNVVTVPTLLPIFQPADREIRSDSLGDTRTAQGFSVPVIARGGTAVPEVLLLRDISDQSATRVGNQLIVNFDVPPSTFAHTDSSAVVSLSAMMADGKPLPGWLKFNPITGEFRGIAPANYQGSLEVSVVATDNHGTKAATRFKIDLASKPAKTSDLGKPRLQTELRAQSSFAWKAERDAWVRHAKDASKVNRAVTPT